MNNTIEQRPWGSFEVLAEGAGYKIKKIIVNPGHRLSLQSHELRKEVWAVVSGCGLFEGGEQEELWRIGPGKSLGIAKTVKHRLINDSKEPLIVIETQLGTCDEDDITRYEDDYGRVEVKQ